jgi:cyclopropane-fatty-acyl-phospholipid synthase
LIDALIETNRVPDSLVRLGIRANCAVRLARERRRPDKYPQHLLDLLRRGPIAEQVDKPNEQHYELPSEFFQLVLGPRLKYSSCWWPGTVETLELAERAMLALSCERAEVEDGMELLDLGCGWGSLTFWLAEHYPNARVLAVSNSRLQRDFIAGRGASNVQVVTADANVFDTDRRFDRVLSVEMFEHLRNYESLLQRIARWLEPDGRLFVHVFSHRRFAYSYESGWIARKFFTAGLMPSHDLLSHFQRDLRISRRWHIDGTHYARTAEAWIENMETNEGALLEVLGERYGSSRARAQLANWRVFFLACAGLWGYRGGREWGVSHYLFERP